jgi:hypothetical protein
MGEFSYCWVNHHWFVIVAFWHSTYNSTFCLFLHSWNIMTLEEIQKSCHNLVSGTWQTRLAYRHTKIIVSFSQWILILFISMQKVINGSKVRYWACINFSRNVQQRTANAFCLQLVQACQTLGMVKFQVFGYPWQLFYNSVIGTNYMPRLSSSCTFLVYMIYLFFHRSLVRNLWFLYIQQDQIWLRRPWSMYILLL